MWVHLNWPHILHYRENVTIYTGKYYYIFPSFLSYVLQVVWNTLYWGKSQVSLKS